MILYFGIERRQVVEKGFMSGHLRIFIVYCLDFQQGKIALIILGRTYLSRDGVAGSQVEPLNLRWRNIDVILTGKVVIAWRTEKSVPLIHDLKHPFGKNNPFSVRGVFHDFVNQLRLAQS